MATRERCAAAVPHIAVAGAGIGGLAAALALAQAGCRVSLVEKAVALTEVGAGLQLSPNATAVLRRLGVLAQVELRAVAPEALEIRRGRDGTVLARMGLGLEARTRFGAPFLVTLRADLQRVLQDAVAETKNIELRTGTGLRGWSQTAETVSLDLGADAAPLVVNGLVGADGLHSVVRQRLWNEPAPGPARRSAWRATIAMTALPLSFRAPRSQLWLGSGAHLVHYPVARGERLNVIAAVDGPLPQGNDSALWSRAGDAADLARRFAGWADPVQAVIAAAPAWGQWPLLDRPALPHWSKDRVTLLGDAAHPMLPFLAQGAAQALEDAARLGDAVAAHPGDVAAAFAVYETARRVRATRVQAQSRRQGTLYHLPPPASAARDLVLRLTPPERLLDRYAWLYGAA